MAVSMELVCGEEILEAEAAVDFRLAVLRPDRETGLNLWFSCSGDGWFEA